VRAHARAAGRRRAVARRPRPGRWPGGAAGDRRPRVGPDRHRRRDRGRGPPARRGRPGLRPAAARQRGGRHRCLPGGGPGGARARLAVRHRHQGHRDRRRRCPGTPGVPRQRGALRVRPARGDHGQGGHQPAPLPVAAGPAAGQARGHRGASAAVAARRTAQGGAARARVGAETGDRARHRSGRGARPGRAARRAGSPAMTVLCLVEQDGTGVSDASLRALTFARALAGERLAAVLFADAAALASGAPARQALAGAGVSDAYVIEPGQLAGYAPLAWARVLAGLTEATGATAVLAAGTDRGSEVMAHLGALAGAPMAANCVAAAASGEGGWRITRQRWAGLLLEDAVLEAPTALLTVATDAVAAAPAAAPASLAVHPHEPELADGDLAVKATESAERAGGISLATARVVVGGGRGVGGPEGFAPLEELAGLLGGVVGVSRVVTSEGW